MIEANEGGRGSATSLARSFFWLSAIGCRLSAIGRNTAEAGSTIGECRCCWFNTWPRTRFPLLGEPAVAHGGDVLCGATTGQSPRLQDRKSVV